MISDDEITTRVFRRFLQYLDTSETIKILISTEKIHKFRRTYFLELKVSSQFCSKFVFET